VAPAAASKLKILFTSSVSVANAVGYIDDVSVRCLTDRFVQVFRNRDGAAGNRVAYGTRDGNGTVNLGEDNASGVSGTVTVAYTADDTGLPSTSGDYDGNMLQVNFLVRGAGAAPTNAFNFGQYLSDTSQTMSAGDWVLMHLGINDIGSQPSDAAVNSHVATTLKPALEAIVGLGPSPPPGSIRAAVPGIRVGLLLTIPPSADQDAFAANYFNGLTRERAKRNVDLLRESMISAYGDLEASNIFVVPYHANLDTWNNMSVGSATALNARTSATMARQSNGVHPAAAGYYQMADSIFSFLKCQE
jgi:lysophospholipase L1-like esterase